MTVSRQPGGTVTSRDGRISCGTAGTSCGPVAYAWAEQAILVATPDAGNMFGTWAGDCSGRTLVGTEYLCVLDTTRYGADKFVAAVFGEAGRTQHVNFTDPAVHGVEFLNWIAKKADTFECTYCHGSTYAGMGIAPSCNDCHAKNGHPGWMSDCTFCHGAPPPPAPATYPDAAHPQVENDLHTCTVCHPDTVDASGTIVPGGKHMNGVIDGGHQAGFAAPAVHGREFFATAATSQACTRCHGASYDRQIVTGNRSCNSCHGENGWAAWQTDCSFCHGVKSAETQAGAYDVSAHPTWSAPPEAISQRLTGVPAPDRTGAHAIHLTGSAFAGPFRCGVCHQVPTALTHISGREVRAAVAIDAPGGTGPDATAYDPTSGTCATYCHDPLIQGAPSPAWSSTGLQCDGCHGLPPASDAHAWASTDLRECAGCHPDTITSSGTLNVAGGKHINGAVDRVGGHDTGFRLPANHGPQYLDHVAGAIGALDCTSCHGTSLTYCTNCHSSTASGEWASWQANCTFCHGQKTPVYSAATDLGLAAPPDAISQRLTGLEVPDRTGQHALHLFNGGFVPAPHFRCATCHPVPADVNHVSVDRRAAVALTAAEAFPALGAPDLARLPSPLGTYDLVGGSCTTYCHGATMQGGVNTLMKWTNDFDNATPIFSCTDCHGSPPLTGQTVIGHTYPTAPTNTRYCGALGCSSHLYHRNASTPNGWDSCSNCHFGSAQGTTYLGLHVNGKPDVVFTPSGTPGYKAFTATWNPVARTCTSSCHTNSGPTTSQPW